MNKFKQQIIGKKLKAELDVKNGIVSVDETSCDGCGKCVKVCPQSAISIKVLLDGEVRRLSLKGRLKMRMKGKNKAYVDQELCTACGLCMRQCHEFAIRKVAK